MNDENFITKWKPIHEKAMAKYVILVPLIYLLIVSITIYGYFPVVKLK